MLVMEPKRRGYLLDESFPKPFRYIRQKGLLKTRFPTTTSDPHLYKTLFRGFNLPLFPDFKYGLVIFVTHSLFIYLQKSKFYFNFLSKLICTVSLGGFVF